MTYDRDEWRRPWQSGDPVAPAGGVESSSTRDVPGPGTATLASSPHPGGGGADVASTDGGIDGREDGQADPADAGDGPGASSPVTTDAPAGRGPSMFTTVLVAALVSLLVAVAGSVATVSYLTPQADGTGAAPPELPPTMAPTIQPVGDAGVIPAVAEAVTPSVVRIDVTDPQAPGVSGRGAIGSGVIYRSDGYVITNHHVVAPAIDGELSIQVRLSTGDVVAAEIVGTDELNDLAVVRIDRTGLPAVNLRTDEPLVVGETVIAIGSPFGLDASVTAGIISALNRELRLDDVAGAGQVIPAVIQTDAAINPGNSGGALVDGQGRLIGINTAILSRSGANQGVGFAVPVRQAISSADQLIATGFVRHPLLGVTGFDVSPALAEEFGLPASRGAVIDSVEEGTGAAEADLRPGDVLLEFDGTALASMAQLVAEVRSRDPGDSIRLRVFRDGEEFEVDVVLGERPR